jgi:outer membrane protein OmpA-like peptidoglycan-associated protein
VTPESREEIILPRNVHFAFDRSKVSPASAKVLDRLVAILKKYPQIDVELSGHTDLFGSNSYNLALGQRRARSVKRYLLGRGIAARRIKISSFGESQPRTGESDRLSRARDRRVYFTLKNAENLGINLVDREEDLQAKFIDGILQAFKI